jgi:hypothetical protein
MMWAIVGMIALVAVTLLICVWAAGAVAKRADEELENYLSDHLTPQERKFIADRLAQHSPLPHSASVSQSQPPSAR